MKTLAQAKSFTLRVWNFHTNNLKKEKIESVKWQDIFDLISSIEYCTEPECSCELVDDEHTDSCATMKPIFDKDANDLTAEEILDKCDCFDDERIELSFN